MPVSDLQTWQSACDAARPGTVIEVVPGSYGGAKLKNKRGRPDAPIVVRAARRAFFSLERHPVGPSGGSPVHMRMPLERDFAFLKIVDCEYVVVEGFQVEGCWPTIFLIQNSRSVCIRHCNLRDGTHAISIKKSTMFGGDVSDIYIHGNYWQQDSSDDHELWFRVSWDEAHGDENGQGCHAYFNGGFVSGKNVLGNVLIEKNRIKDAYNGIRMKVESDYDLDRPMNSNVHIVNNTFKRIRDNPTEPERFAHKWFVYYNKIIDCHSWFSFDDVGGGYWYYYGNTGNFETRQGHPKGTLPPGASSSHTMGRVLKLSYVRHDGSQMRRPSWPWYVFNNSWRLRCPIIGGSQLTDEEKPHGPDYTSRLRFLNNAFERCDMSECDDVVCAPIEPIRNFDFKNSHDVVFDFSAWTSWPVRDYGQSFPQGSIHETDGLRSPEPFFTDGQHGDFEPVAGSVLARTGTHVWLATPDGRWQPRPQGDGTLNRGAVQDYGKISVPGLERETEQLRTSFDWAKQGSVGPLTS